MSSASSWGDVKKDIHLRPRGRFGRWTDRGRNAKCSFITAYFCEMLQICKALGAAAATFWDRVAWVTCRSPAMEAGSEIAPLETLPTV